MLLLGIIEVAPLAIYTAISAVVCGCVSSIELLHRYSHAAKSSTILWNIPAASYLAINLVVGALAALAGNLTGALTFDVSSDSVRTGDVFKAICTGLVGLAILRSSLATFKTDAGETSNLGLSLILDKILDLLDKKIDFSQKIAASSEISKIMQDIDPEIARYDLAMLCLAGVKSISQQDAEDLHRSLDSIFESSAYHSRSILVGHALYNVCGIDILRHSVGQLQGKIKSLPACNQGVESSSSLARELNSELDRLKQN